VRALAAYEEELATGQIRGPKDGIQRTGSEVLLERLRDISEMRAEAVENRGVAKTHFRKGELQRYLEAIEKARLIESQLPRVTFGVLDDVAEALGKPEVLDESDVLGLLRVHGERNRLSYDSGRTIDLVSESDTDTMNHNSVPKLPGVGG
jgi:hypothetical protein